MKGRSRFRFRYRGIMGALAQSLSNLFDKILADEETAGNANVFYDPQDLTSLRVGRDGSGGQPVVGDPVGMMLDTSPTGSQTMAEFLAGATNEFADGAATVGGEMVNAGGGRFTLSGGNPASSQTVNSAFVGVSGTAYEVTVNIASIANDSISIRPVAGGNVGALGVGTHKFIFESNGSTQIVQMIEWGGTLTDIDVTFSIKAIPGHHAIAPSDAARPILYDEFDTSLASLTDDGTRGEETVTTSYPATFVSQLCGALNSNALEIGELYEITWDVASVGGSTTLFLVDSTAGGAFAYQVLTSTAGTGSVVARCNAKNINGVYVGGTATINSISVRKVNTAFDERGDELTTNPDFSTGDVSGYTPFGGASIVHDTGGDGNRGKLVFDGTIYSGVRADYSGSIEVGKVYELKFDFAPGTFTGTIQLTAEGQNTTPVVMFSGTSEAGTYSTLLVPNNTPVRQLRIRAQTTPNPGDYFFIDNISVKEVLTPTFS